MQSKATLSHGNASKRDASRASRRGCSCEAVRPTAWFGGVFIMLMRDFGLLPPVPDLPIFLTMLLFHTFTKAKSHVRIGSCSFSYPTTCSMHSNRNCRTASRYFFSHVLNLAAYTRIRMTYGLLQLTTRCGLYLYTFVSPSKIRRCGLYSGLIVRQLQ